MGSIAFTVACPGCGHEFREALEKLQNGAVVCPSCREEIEVHLRDELGRDMTTRFGPVRTIQGARSVRYSIELSHPQLHKHRLIQGPDLETIKAKAAHQAAEWDEVWEKRSNILQKLRTDEEKRQEAAQRTQEAQAALQSVGRS